MSWGVFGVDGEEEEEVVLAAAVMLVGVHVIAEVTVRSAQSLATAALPLVLRAVVSKAADSGAPRLKSCSLSELVCNMYSRTRIT